MEQFKYSETAMTTIQIENVPDELYNHNELFAPATRSGRVSDASLPLVAACFRNW